MSKRYREITLSDIARELNVSKSTVSRALQDHHSIGEETKKAVLELAGKYNYQPNAIASSLSRRNTRTIGVIVPILSHYFFSIAIAGIEEVAYEAGYSVVICQSAERYEREVTVSRSLLSGKVDGLIISLARETHNFDHFRLFQQRNIPLVFFDRICREMDTASVTADNYAGAFNAVEHLIEQGYRRIAHFAGPPSLLISKSRLKGYRDALKKHSIPFDKNLVFACGLEREDGIRATQKLLGLEQLPDAIFAVCDRVAIAAMVFLKEQGMRIPAQIAVVGFNDDPTATVIEPALSTVVLPAFEMGQAAARLLLKQISTATVSTSAEVLATRLMVRKSSLR